MMIDTSSRIMPNAFLLFLSSETTVTKATQGHLHKQFNFACNKVGLVPSPDVAPMQPAFLHASPLVRTANRPARCSHPLTSLRRPPAWAITCSDSSESRETPSNPKRSPPNDQPATSIPQRRRMPMPAETRRKISAALKGRRKSPEHRESLRRRFEGSQNPMYGRKLSAESRAKISRAMAAKGKQKKQDNVDKPEQANSPAKRKNKQLMEQTLDQLREKAVQSKLITSATQPPPKRKPNRILHDDLEAAHLDKILKRVASLDEPPEAVVRTLQNNRKRREKNTLERRAANNRGRAASEPPSTGLSEKSDKKALPEPDKTVDASERNCQCTVCNGTGLMQCPNCVGTFGVSSSRCDLCFGAGGVFCDTCQGVGSVIT